MVGASMLDPGGIPWSRPLLSCPHPSTKCAAVKKTSFMGANVALRSCLCCQERYICESESLHAPTHGFKPLETRINEEGMWNEYSRMVNFNCQTWKCGSCSRVSMWTQKATLISTRYKAFTRAIRPERLTLKEQNMCCAIQHAALHRKDFNSLAFQS
eukprot:scaffold8874_cov21-Tisochrysis_lutea.AAC.2